MSTLTVFDLDDTLAMTEQFITAPFNQGLFELVSTIYQEMDFQSFDAKMMHLYRSHGTAIHGLMHDLGKDMVWAMECFEQLSPSMVQAVFDNLQRDQVLIDKLHTLQQRGHTLAVLTAGHRDYALPVLQHLGVSTLIPDHMVFDISSVGGQLKRTEHPYRHVLNELADKVFLHHNMVEDSPVNLGPAKKLGFTTWLVGDKTPSEELLPLIDHRHKSIHGVLDALLAA